MANRYWVGGTGTWNASNTTNWSTTSGGAGGASVPSTADVALFDANSGAGTVTLGYNPTVQSVNMTGFTQTFDGVGTTYTITLNNIGTVWIGEGTIIGSPNITLSAASITNRTFAGGGKTYGILTIGGTTGINVLTVTGNNTFSELRSTKPVAHTITFSADQTINTWSVTGSSGNVVTVNSSGGIARTLTITNRTSGIDYLYVSYITAPLTPVTFFIGANSRLFGYTQGVAATTAPSNRFVYVLNTGTSWTVPANWENTNNEIHLFGGGGGGGGSQVTTTNSTTGAGGGGGGYTKITNLSLTPGSSVSYAIGAAGTAAATAGSGGNGGTTTFDSGTYTASVGTGATTVNVPPRENTPGTGGAGSTYNGGNGGNGSEFGNTISFGAGGGGGGGGGGPLGNGGVGGDSYLDANSNNISGGGGGGNGGGGNGGNGASAVGGTGGNNNAGVGGGTSGANGFNGGGGGGNVGVFAFGTNGGSGIDISKAGLGGGGGGGGAGQRVGASGGLYGGGGSGGGATPSGANQGGGAGGQGGIIIWYETPIPTTGNFFFLFG